LRGIRATIGRLRAVTARTTIRVTSIAWASPEVAAWKKIDVTAAEPIAEASCWIELNEPLALPASSGFASPTIQLRDGGVVLRAGQMVMVPKGVERCPSADGEVHALLIEPVGVANSSTARQVSPTHRVATTR
jgi:hypothetical protein